MSQRGQCGQGRVQHETPSLLVPSVFIALDGCVYTAHQHTCLQTLCHQRAHALAQLSQKKCMGVPSCQHEQLSQLSRTSVLHLLWCLTTELKICELSQEGRMAIASGMQVRSFS